MSDPNSVGFEIRPISSSDGSREFAAEYVGRGKTAKFTFEISDSKPMPPDGDVNLAMSSGTGAIVSESDSDASDMLAALQKALEAKHLPSRAKRALRLPFEFVVLGERNSQAKDGGFYTKPAGNWTTMKIFMGEGDDECEVFLNFNPVSGKAQFAEKDVDYGDLCLAQLATVL